MQLLLTERTVSCASPVLAALRLCWPLEETRTHAGKAARAALLH